MYIYVYVGVGGGDTHNSSGRPVHFVFSYIFLLLLSTPLIFSLFGRDVSLHLIGENRNLASYPDFRTTSVKDLPGQWDSYFKDRMPFRQIFMPGYIFAYEKVLKTYVSEYVTGRGNELFMNHAAPVIDTNLGIWPYNSYDKEHLRLTAAGKHAYFLSKGIPYYLFLAPDKSTLYPELLPFYAKWIPHRTWYQEQKGTLEKANINFYPLKDFLWQFKNHERLYDIMYDNCHWNGTALVHAYKYFADILAKDNPIFSPVAYGKYYTLEHKKFSVSVYGDESTGFIDLRHTENFICSTLPSQYRTENYNKLCTNSTLKKGSLWFFSDSYFGETHGSYGVTPFVHNVHTYIHRHYGMNKPFTQLADETLKFNRPDAVIEEFVERMCGPRHSLQDPLLRVLGDFWLKTRGILLEHRTNFSEFTIQNVDRSESSPDLFTVRAGNRLTLKSAVTADDLGRVVIMGRIDVPDNAVINVRFKYAGTDTWQEINFGLNKDHKIFHETIRVRPFSKVNLSLHFQTPGTYRLGKIQEIDDLRERM